MVIRTVTGGGAQLAATHSQSFEGWYASVPGLKVVVPSTPYDALGLLRTSVRENNPIIFTEHALLYGVRGEVPSEYYDVPFGQAAVRRQGADVTIIGYSRMAHVAQDAADILAERGRHAEVIDLRTLRPTRRRHHCGIGQEDQPRGRCRGGVAYGWIRRRDLERDTEEAFDYLDGPVVRVGGLDVPAPYSGDLEAATIPTPGGSSMRYPGISESECLSGLTRDCLAVLGCPYTMNIKP